MGRLKIVYPVCCGMDVHRDFVIANSGAVGPVARSFKATDTEF